MSRDAAIGLLQVILFAMLMSLNTVARASSYEGELQAVAQNLVERLEAAGHTNGTVLDFRDLQGQGTELGRFLAQELSDKLVSSAKKLAILDRESLQYLLHENKLSADGLVDPSTTRKLGKIIGVDTLIVGTATPLGNRIRLSVRAISVETGEIVASRSATLTGTDELIGLYGTGVVEQKTADSGQEKSTLNTKITANTFKLAVEDFSVPPEGYSDSGSLTFSIENRGDLGVNVGVSSYSISAGPCAGPDVAGLAGLGVVDADSLGSGDTEQAQRLQWLPAGGKVTSTASIYAQRCNSRALEGLSAVPVSMSLVVVSNNEVITVPLSADSAKVRFMH